MKLSDFSLEALKAYVTGDGSDAAYMSGPDLVKFFNMFGVRDVYSFKDGGLPNNGSRKDYAFSTIKSLNGTTQMKPMIEGLVDSRHVENYVELAKEISEIIKHDGYALEQNSMGVFVISGANIEEDRVDIDAHFQDIRARILESINCAQFSIWVAMAWFTDKEIGNALLKKHLGGLNVQVVVNDDQTTEKYGLDFTLKGIEYYKVAPSSPWGKKIMHNKFCVIDLKKVVHGSYNWSNNAQYNNESITIADSRELAEDFANQFIALKLSHKKNA